MTASDVPELYQNTWAVYEALRRLGFEDEQIRHEASDVVFPDGTPGIGEHIVVKLTAQDKICTFIIGRLDRSFDDARETLERLRMAVASGLLPEAECRRLWSTSAMGNVHAFESVAITILNKGIAIPAFVN